MSDFKVNERQAEILRGMGLGLQYAAEGISRLFVDAPSPATLRRDMQELETLGLVERYGQKRGTKYEKTVRGAFFTPLDAHSYFLKEVDVRNGLERYHHGLWDAIPSSLFTDKELNILDSATERFTERSRDLSDTLRAKELERFVIELSWKSSRIEGNTYTLLDTERLLREGIEAPGHTKDEATMVINHKKAFQYILEAKDSRPVFDKRFVEDVHAILVEGLGVSRGFRKGVVGISGSLYRPLDIPAQLEEETAALCEAVARLHDAYSQALLLLVGLSYIQPFEDGNKRTARLITNAVLVSNERAPLSYRSVNEIQYRESMLSFYEQLSLSPMKKIFTEQYLFACEQYVKEEVRQTAQ